MARNEKEILGDIRDVRCAMSPENISCDGMRPAREVRREESRLQAKLDSLVKELGRDPSLEEIWDDHPAVRRLKRRLK